MIGTGTDRSYPTSLETRRKDLAWREVLGCTTTLSPQASVEQFGQRER